ncbi:uncharacterized protein LOC110365176 [Columba livia]|uniref:uncharacterized protein LOC110365176 n=1 Tax=Columba livia TaxID=8932 RepID=UPI0031BA32A7
MAAETQWSCPMCRSADDEVAYVTPCMHQLCLGCVLRWAKRRSSCPLCRQTVNTVVFSVWSEHDFLEMDLPEPSDPSADSDQDEQEAAELMRRNYVAALQPQVWAGLFRSSREIMEPLLSWVNEVLQGPFWWELAMAQGTIVTALCRHGLDQEALVRELRPFLRDQTATFVRQLMDVAAERCSERVLRQLPLLQSPAAQQQDDSPADTPGPTASPGGPAAPSPPAQEEPPEELGQAVAGPSTAAQGRDRSPGEPRRAPKRRASVPSTSAAHKRPRHRRQ